MTIIRESEAQGLLRNPEQKYRNYLNGLLN